MYLADQLALLFFRSLALLGAFVGCYAVACLTHALLRMLFDFLLERTTDRRPRL